MRAPRRYYRHAYEHAYKPPRMRACGSRQCTPNRVRGDAEGRIHFARRNVADVPCHRPESRLRGPRSRRRRDRRTTEPIAVPDVGNLTGDEPARPQDRGGASQERASRVGTRLPRAPGNADPKVLGRSRHAARVLRRTESTCRSSAAKPGPTCGQGWGWEWEGRIRTVTRLEESMRHPEDTFRRAEQSICVSEDSIVRSILAAILLVTAEKP